MNKLNKKYQLWHWADSGYHLKEFDNLNEITELIENIYTSDYYITQALKIKIQEIGGDTT